MVGIGIVGIGFMGMTHFEGARTLKGGRVAAIATRNPKKLAGDWSSIQGNFGPRGSDTTDLTGINTHADYHDVLADDSEQQARMPLRAVRVKHEQVSTRKAIFHNSLRRGN